MERKRIKIYSEKWPLKGRCAHTAMLDPFWGNSTTTPDPQERSLGKFQPYVVLGRDLFEMTDLKEADIAGSGAKLLVPEFS